MAPLASIPEHVGPYKTLRALDAGGLGRVLIAERSDFEQRVVIKFGAPTAGGVRREGAILALLKHEKIVQLLGTGESDSGEYLVLEYVDGLPIDEFCRVNNLPADARLELVRQVTAAVAYAHHRLIIHADMKPSNVLVTRDENGRARVKVLDFGIARRLGDGPDEQIFYTPLYASPEQKEGKPPTVLTDIYLLGLLCGTLLGSSLRGDLRAVVNKALQISPEDRYGSADALGEDLERVEKGLPTSVRPVTTAELAWRWSRRRPVLASAVAVFACVVALSAGSVLMHQHRAFTERRLADEQLREAIQLTGLLQGDLYRATGSLTGSDRARKQLRDTALRTLNALASIASNQPLRLEVAKQFGNLAELEMADPGNPDRRARADREVRQGMALLGDSNEPEVAQARRSLQEIQSAFR